MNLNDKLITVEPLLILQDHFFFVQTNNFVVLRGNKQYQKLVIFTFKSIYRSQLKLLGLLILSSFPPNVEVKDLLR